MQGIVEVYFFPFPNNAQALRSSVPFPRTLKGTLKRALPAHALERDAHACSSRRTAYPTSV